MSNRFRFEKMELDKLAVDTLEVATVDSALNVYFSQIEKAASEDLHFSKHETQQGTMDNVSILEEITMIRGTWNLGMDGLIYSNKDLKKDIALWKSWCASKKMLLGWDTNQKKVYNKFFRNNTDLAMTMVDRYFEILATAIDEQPFYPGTGGEGRRLVDVLSAMERITGHRSLF
ncbi:hypothetical protein GWN42_26395 [candidate division KSB1 bacterium]|nr:hypothetical protein [candidate division KSB1 bacterium]NIV96221.1 hypothetical protein [candidate division KSB1 bacterium]NIW72048.1 hypothetical protein [candidate division KSB1 bacterium]